MTDTEPVPGIHTEAAVEALDPELDQRIETLTSLLEKLDDKQKDRLLNYDDGQTITSVLLGLKPAMILGLRPYRRPLELTKAIQRHVPGQFELSNNFFYDPGQVRKVIADNQDLFPKFDVSRQSDTNYLSRYVDSSTPQNSYGLAMAELFLSVVGLSSSTTKDHMRNGLILGFPRSAVDSFPKKGPRKTYQHFGYQFTYFPESQSDVDTLDTKLSAAYKHAEESVSLLKTRPADPKVFF